MQVSVAGGNNAAGLRIKRVYDPATPDDGCRILVDRVWPRGVQKQRARISLWLKSAAPSTELRKWFGHDPARWQEFRRRYLRELEEKQDELAPIRAELKKTGRVTLVYSARDTERNQAVVLLEYLANEGSNGRALRRVGRSSGS